MEEDLELLDRWCAGEAAAGSALFKRHFATVYRFFEHKTDGEPDDLVQETFLQCVRSRASFRRQSSFRTYLLAIARHVLIAHWRRQARAQPGVDLEAVSIASLSTSAGSRLAKTEDHARLIAVLLTLPIDVQLLLEMYYWEDLGRDQLAEVFEVEVATIGSRLYRARQALHAALNGATGGAAGEPSEALDRWARSLRAG